MKWKSFLANAGITLRSTSVCLCLLKSRSSLQSHQWEKEQTRKFGGRRGILSCYHKARGVILAAVLLTENSSNVEIIKTLYCFLYSFALKLLVIYLCRSSKHPPCTANNHRTPLRKDLLMTASAHFRRENYSSPWFWWEMDPHHDFIMCFLH